MKTDLWTAILPYCGDNTGQKCTGIHLVYQGLFCFLYGRTEEADPLLLCTTDGLILSGSDPKKAAPLCGRRLSLTSLRTAEPQLTLCEGQGYVLVTTAHADAVAAANRTCRDMAELLQIYQRKDDQNQYLLHCLDALHNAVSIYDKDARLLYANRMFCSNMQISDPTSVLGMPIEEILTRTGMKVHAMATNSHRMKMMDVLQTGKEVLDWEVRLESTAFPNSAQLVSNDLYPILDTKGRVLGMVELMRSHQQEMTRTRKLAGLSAEYTFDHIIGQSMIMQERIRIAKEFAGSPFNLLITGESGVGKELFAQSIHNSSSRRKGPFVALNCANFSEGLIESELFGYIGGAFTGASKNGQVGKFELADGGTLFLDEIGELPYHFQSKLLRVLETWTITRIGSSKQIPVNVRVIAATNRNLEEMVEEGLFRQDLYYRLQVLTVEIPALRERKEDIPLLAETFLRLAAASGGRPVSTLEPAAQQMLMHYDWPGNVRELRNVMNRATVLSKTSEISCDVLELSLYSKNGMRKTAAGAASTAPCSIPLSSCDTPEERLAQIRQQIDAFYITLLKEALAIAKNNKTQAAALLGISRKTIYRMIEKYHLEEEANL